MSEVTISEMKEYLTKKHRNWEPGLSTAKQYSDNQIRAIYYKEKRKEIINYAINAWYASEYEQKQEEQAIKMHQNLLHSFVTRQRNKTLNEFLDDFVCSKVSLITKVQILEELTGKPIFADIRPQHESEVHLRKEELIYMYPPSFKVILDQYYKEMGIDATSKVNMNNMLDDYSI